MIIDYCFGNYRSFREKNTFSMKASSQTTFNDILLRTLGERILPSSVIYGANASGKSNIVDSLQTFRNIVITGTVSSVKDLELCPFIHDNNDEPVYFGMDFINGGKRFVYNLQINTGKITEKKRFIVNEELYIVIKKKNHLIFNRTEKSINISYDTQVLKLLKTDATMLDNFARKLNENMDVSELFLARGFKSIISSEIADIIIDFFTNKLFAVKDFTLQSFNLAVHVEEEMGRNFVMWNKVLESFVRGADFGPQKILFKANNENDNHTTDMQLMSVYQNGTNNVLIPAELMESKGTLKLIDFAIVFQTLFLQGGTFVVDEFDAALHPEIVKGILSLFNNPEFNKNSAQLIFTTHNPIYLNNKIFRRDQIRFVEKDKDTFQSVLYSLSDFGSTDVRNDENYLINYFKGKYSTLPFIDFSSLIKGDVK